jgi:hypothetical protein
MLVPFENLPEDARIWIYQSNKRLTENQTIEISDKLKTFLNQWAAHGQDLMAAFEIKYDRFITIGLNQAANKATGCSIDSQVQFVQALEKEYNIDLLDKMNVSFKQGEFVNYKPLTDFRAMAKNGAVGKKTIVFNNLVTNKAEYLENWEVPASESWHARFLK